MVISNRVMVITKVGLAFVAIALWLTHFYLYESFVNQSSKVSNLVRPVMVNDHGSFVYITVHQSNVLNVLTGFAVASFVVAVLIDVYQRKHSAEDR
jgi:hypothetical protein